MPRATGWTHTGLGLVTLATLGYQILLTRIFSVTIWYHFAFLAVSLAMLGMTIGAIAVYLLPAAFPPERVHRQLAGSALAFALTIAASLLVHLAVPVPTDGSPGSIAAIAFTCTVIAIPFTASGICVALALTRFPARVSTLYAADLCGAAIGCLSLVGLLAVTDGPTAVFAVATVAGLGALCFAADAASRRLERAAAASVALLGVFVVGHTVLVQRQTPLLRIRWTVTRDGPRPSPPPLYERWNSHSRIRVFGNPDLPGQPFGWSLSAATPAPLRARQLLLDIDSGALTVLTAFDGSLEPLEYLKYDITNLAHHLRRGADVLVIGAGRRPRRALGAGLRPGLGGGGRGQRQHPPRGPRRLRGVHRTPGPPPQGPPGPRRGSELRGHGLSVVLFSLLFSSGLGSLSTRRVPDARLAGATRRRLVPLLAVLALFGLATPAAAQLLASASTPVRVLAAVGVLFPAGFLMGMPFPLGMRAASGASGARELTPWLWGMNGATTVLAIAVAMTYGISAAFWVGFGAYLLAAAALLRALGPGPAGAAPS